MATQGRAQQLPQEDERGLVYDLPGAGISVDPDDVDRVRLIEPEGGEPFLSGDLAGVVHWRDKRNPTLEAFRKLWAKREELAGIEKSADHKKLVTYQQTRDQLKADGITDTSMIDTQVQKLEEALNLKSLKGSVAKLKSLCLKAWRLPAKMLFAKGREGHLVLTLFESEHKNPDRALRVEVYDMGSGKSELKGKPFVVNPIGGFETAEEGHRRGFLYLIGRPFDRTLVAVSISGERASAAQWCQIWQGHPGLGCDIKVEAVREETFLRVCPHSDVEIYDHLKVTGDDVEKLAEAWSVPLQRRKALVKEDEKKVEPKAPPATAEGEATQASA